MMATARLLRLPGVPARELISNSLLPWMGTMNRTTMSLNDIPQAIGRGHGRPLVVQAAGCAPACELITSPKAEKVMDLAVLAYAGDGVCKRLKIFNEGTQWRFHVQEFVEKVIIDCRFFAFLAVAGSFIGSVLCFVEGCLLVAESYFRYFHSLARMSEQGQVILLLIEAIDMFLMGTAMIIFGMALHAMFVGTSNVEVEGSALSRTSNLEMLASRRSVIEAKSKIAHAVILILQVEVLEKIKSIDFASCLDLVCFAGVMLLCSASILLLSKIAVTHESVSS